MLARQFHSSAARHFHKVARRSLLLEIGYLAQAEAEALRGDRYLPKSFTRKEQDEFEALMAVRRAAWSDAEALPNGAAPFQLLDRYAELQAHIEEREQLAYEITKALMEGAVLVARRHTVGPLVGVAIFAVVADPGMVVVDAATEGDELGPVVACPECGAKKRKQCVDGAGKPTAWHSRRIEDGTVHRAAAMRRELSELTFIGALGLTFGGHNVAHAGDGFVRIDRGEAMPIAEAILFLVDEEVRHRAAQRMADVFVGERGAGVSEARLALEQWRERCAMEAA